MVNRHPGHCFRAARAVFALLTALSGRLSGQVPDSSTLVIIKDARLFHRVASADASRAMVNIKQYVPGVITDLRYTTRNNFTHQALYPVITTTYSRRPAAEALALVQQALHNKGLGLKVFDAYRPYRVTKKMWVLIHDDRYVANPSKGSGHNRGTAIDLTIVDLQTKQELNMGTGFDNFTDTAHHSFTQLPAGVLANRQLLRSLMEQHGFTALESEWWHYNLKNADRFEVLNISFKALRKMSEP